MTHISVGVERFVEVAMRHLTGDMSLSHKLHVARFLGEVLWKNSTGIYQLAGIENALVERIEPLIPSQVIPASHAYRFGHVMTKAYDTGGHTRLVERLMSSKTMADSLLIVTAGIAPAARERLDYAGYHYTVLSREAKADLRIAALVEEFSRCEVLILYVHPYDIESVIAAGIARRRSGVRVLLFNHADHVFSWGYGVAERVLEISHFGWALRNKRQCEDRSVFVGIPLALPSTLVPKPALPSRSQVLVMAAGTAYKFRPAQGWSFPNFVQSLCQRTGCSVEIVGPNRWLDCWWWPALRGKYRLHVHARLEYEKYLALISKADAFVDSFPLSGGTAFAESIARGTPGFGVLTGSHGYSPADLVKSPSLGELLDDIVCFIKSGVRSGINVDELFALLYEVHDVEEVALRVVNAVSGEGIGVPPPWPCSVAIDIEFFERVWLEQCIPTLPVHVFPPPALLIPFLMLKKDMGKLFRDQS